MKTNIRWLVAAFTIGYASPAAAQVPSTVQLPSYSTYGVSTSVSVPDRGRVSLGGIGRSSSGSTAFGPALGPGSRSYGRQTGSANVDVRVTIHDFDAMDKLLLGQTPASGSAVALQKLEFRAIRSEFCRASSARKPRGGSSATRCRT